MNPKTAIQQAAAIPYRRRKGRLEICLITAIRSGNWSIPKGLIDPGDTARATALKESLEEAGIRGKLVGDPVGQYHYDKWGTTLTVEVYMLEVEVEEADWEEREYRERLWATPREALDLLVGHPGLDVIEAGLRRLS